MGFKNGGQRAGALRQSGIAGPVRCARGKKLGRSRMREKNIWQGEERKFGGGGAQHDSAEGSFEG
jgi:hypothetical protein